MSTRDEVSLSAQERQVLANLEARAHSDDPALAARLRGRRWRAVIGRSRDWHPPELAPWVGPLALGIGLMLTLIAVVSVVWLSVLGVGLAVAGGCVIGKDLRERFNDTHDAGD